MALLLAIGIPAVGCGLVALGVYFGRKSLDWADLYDVWDEGAK